MIDPNSVTGAVAGAISARALGSSLADATSSTALRQEARDDAAP